MVLCNVPFCVLKGIQASLVRHALLSSLQQFENMFVLHFLNMINLGVKTSIKSTCPQQQEK
jgi:hypothetical protein